jgi:putative hemolysin
MNQLKTVIIGIAILCFVLGCGCTGREAPPATPPQDHQSMGNPASLYCTSLGYESVVKKDANGSETGVCRMPNGTEVDEWELYRSTHPPG